ncbi:hypothetical protein LCGC14_0919250 [marine sediment metagenome]|uniref:Cardiolipin synthase N-terminal domain-containing protein n=1 Tax=marine sediment metagenome TaxID=412755 RepID=A0A0F9RXW8_9ZZZZ|nr:hypothetical protein [bacterium]
MTVQYPMVSILWIPLIIIIIIIYLIGIGLAVWVYNDAKKRDMNAAVWLLIVLLTSFIGCIIFLKVRE